MLTQIIMSLADATQPAFSTMVMMIKCCNCAQLHSYFHLIVSMPCSSKSQILSNSICAEAPVVIRLVVGWPKLGNFLHHMDQFRVPPHPRKIPLSAPGYPLSSCRRKFAETHKGISAAHQSVLFLQCSGVQNSVRRFSNLISFWDVWLSLSLYL